jgi:pimeloyl-ACP methyl ester carboxylesterase
MDHLTWGGVVPGLARSFRVLRYDRRGHSRSERVAGPGGIRNDVADLDGLLETLDFAPAHILGNSFGGAIVLRLACERPELFRSLLAHEPTLFDLLAGDPTTQTALDEWRRRESRVVEHIARGDMEGGARQFVETVAAGPGAWDRIQPEIRQTMIANAATFPDETQDPGAFTLDLAALAGFTRPALLSHGNRSFSFFPPIVRKLAGVLPRAELREFAGAGHVPHTSHPAEFVDAVTAFVIAVETGQAGKDACE